MSTSDAPAPRGGRSNDRSVACVLCGHAGPQRAFAAYGGLRAALAEHIAATHPRDWRPEERICPRCLRTERINLVLRRMEEERGELSVVESEIARKAAEHETLAANIDAEFDSQATRGQRLADAVASIGGSWPFVLVFVLLLAAWVAVNTLLLGPRAFDPYPYILLNLFLSTLAAIQAPVIMMSQNRVSARDRLQADQDFRTNLKAEIEIATLHEKVDHLLHTQYQRMVELQELQLDLLEELAGRRSR